MSANHLYSSLPDDEWQNASLGTHDSGQYDESSMSHYSESYLKSLNRFLIDNGAPPIKRPTAAKVSFSSEHTRTFTLGELLNRPANEIPQLVSPLLQRKGLAVLAGSSDTGKSSFLRQLALAIATGEPDFLGFPIHANHKRAICVSTEDNDEALPVLLRKQLHGIALPKDAQSRLRFVFNTDDLLENLDWMLSQAPADLVVIDALGDIFEGNLNQSNEVRRFLERYNALANKHGCLILFMHHTGKRSEDRQPSKDNLLGSQGLEAKMRVVLELRADPYNREIRHLCVLKGNYIASDLKAKSYALRFDENLRFHNTGHQKDFADLVKAPEESANERKLWKIAKGLLEEGNSYDKTAELLVPIAKNLSVSSISRATLNRRIPKSTLHATASSYLAESDDEVEASTTKASPDT